MEQPLWTPSESRIRRAQITRFIESVRTQTGNELPDYAAVHRWSIEDPERFWGAVWSFAGWHSGDRPDGP